MLSLHFAEPYASPPTAGCPMPTAVGHNFVSRLQEMETCFGENEGPLSIKCCFGGQEIYETEGTRLTVEETSYLVLNQGQCYTSAMESLIPWQGKETAESFCVWFRPGFAEQVRHSLTLPDARLLDDALPDTIPPTDFFDRLYPHDELVSPTLFRIRRAVLKGSATQDWMEEQFHLLMEALLQMHLNVYREAERLPAMRQSTRLELYRRLHRARDYMTSHWDLRVSLSEVANAACLSPHHFLRQFAHLFGETPHQYHRRTRLERARTLLLTTESPVVEICIALGFESLGSFSGLFRRHFGLAPAQYRARYGQRSAVRLLAE